MWAGMSLAAIFSVCHDWRKQPAERRFLNTKAWILPRRYLRASAASSTWMRHRRSAAFIAAKTAA